MNDLEKLKNFLKNELELLDKSLVYLTHSIEKAKNIGIKDKYTVDELEVFEALSSRFARSADILTQKILKTMFIIMQEDAKTFIDRCNLCEKLGIVENGDVLFKIRKLRNDIAHEYSTTQLKDLFSELLECSMVLIQIVGKIKNFIYRRIL